MHSHDGFDGLKLVLLETEVIQVGELDVLDLCEYGGSSQSIYV